MGKNKLAFDGETLENIAMKIERWYDVKVQLTDERLKDVKYEVPSLQMKACRK